MEQVLGVRKIVLDLLDALPYGPLGRVRRARYFGEREPTGAFFQGDEIGEGAPDIGRHFGHAWRVIIVPGEFIWTCTVPRLRVVPLRNQGGSSLTFSSVQVNEEMGPEINVDLSEYMWYICIVPQLHLYVPKEVAAELKRRAKAKGKTVSGFLAELVQGEISDSWPEGFFTDVAGGWAGEPMTRPSDSELEERDEL